MFTACFTRDRLLTQEKSIQLPPCESIGLWIMLLMAFLIQLSSQLEVGNRFSRNLLLEPNHGDYRNITVVKATI
jgi:hypothetical protein